MAKMKAGENKEGRASAAKESSVSGMISEMKTSERHQRMKTTKTNQQSVAKMKERQAKRKRHQTSATAAGLSGIESENVKAA